MPDQVRGKPVPAIGDTELLDPSSFDPAVDVLISGPAQSGRTNALRWLASRYVVATPGRR